MKKAIATLAIALLMAVVMVVPALATQPQPLSGSWSNLVGDPQTGYTYSLDGDCTGTVDQPAKPGRAQKGTFTGWCVDPSYDGTCVWNVVGVGPVGKTIKLSGHLTTLKCEGGLEGFHAVGVQWVAGPDSGGYIGTYHFDG